MSSFAVARRLAFATFVAAAAATAPGACAQTESSALSHAEVSAETLAAMQAGQMMPAGERALPDPHVSIKTREQRKAETLLARRGDVVGGGLATYRDSISQQIAGKNSTKTRAERKAETMDAITHKQMLRAGEAA